MIAAAAGVGVFNIDVCRCANLESQFLELQNTNGTLRKQLQLATQQQEEQKRQIEQLQLQLQSKRKANADEAMQCHFLPVAGVPAVVAPARNPMDTYFSPSDQVQAQDGSSWLGWLWPFGRGADTPRDTLGAPIKPAVAV